MVLQKSNTSSSLLDKTVDVQSAVEMLRSFPSDSRSITITKPEKSGDSYAITVTTELSDGTQTVTSSDVWPSILIEELVGSFLQNRKESTSESERIDVV